MDKKTDSVAEENQEEIESGKAEENGPKLDKRLENLLKRTEKFSEFVQLNTVVTINTIKQRDPSPTRTTRSKKSKSYVRSVKKITKVSSDEKFEGFTESPQFINGHMRDYQVAGLNWLIKLRENGFNGILADEMGLGKTLQTISLLGYLKYHKNVSGKHLIFAPKSTVNNWVSEVKMWCPEFRPIAMIGTKEEKLHIRDTIVKPGKFDILITNYETINNMPLKTFTDIDWNYIVIDEGHRLKNENSLFSQLIRKVTSENRLILTGTPLQNNLHELWALLNFLVPDIFDSAEDFDAWFDTSTVLSSSDTLVQRLHKILNPFFLRRIKSDVESALLPKLEYKLFAPLTTLQRELYIQTLKKEFGVWHPIKLEKVYTSSVMQILMNLRKTCNHPWMLPGVEEEPFINDERLVQVCGKMQLLDKLLVMLKEQGSRVLIFSQFKGMLTILEDFCALRNYDYCRLDGETAFDDRSDYMKEFNEKNSKKFIFLLSTRAGGLGINLQTADTVILYDSDWNPQMDKQAEDRAHRIGQPKQVRVFRLITEKTIDERIIQRAAIKLQLDKKVIQEGRLVDNMKLGVNEVRGMINMDMQEIMNYKVSSITDVTIQEIMRKSNEKSADLEEKVQKSVINFESFDTIFKFDGENYHKDEIDPIFSWMNDKQESKRSSRFKRSSNNKSESPYIAQIEEKPEEPTPEYPFHENFKDFQFYRPKLRKLLKQEFYWHLKSTVAEEEIEDMPLRLKWKVKNATRLYQIDKKKKIKLQKDGFDWTVSEFTTFWKWIQQNGFQTQIAKQIVPTRSVKEINRYNDAFWKYFCELKDPTIRKFCYQELFNKWEAALNSILKCCKGDFLNLARQNNKLLSSNMFHRKVVAFMLEKFYNEAKTNDNLFQDISKRILRAPEIFRNEYNKDNIMPTPDVIKKEICLTISICSWNVSQYENDRDVLGLWDLPENLKLGIRETSSVNLEDEPDSEDDEKTVEYLKAHKETINDSESSVSDDTKISNESGESGYESKMSSVATTPIMPQRRASKRCLTSVLTSTENFESTVEEIEKTQSSAAKRPLEMETENRYPKVAVKKLKLSEIY